MHRTITSLDRDRGAMPGGAGSSLRFFDESRVIFRCGMTGRDLGKLAQGIVHDVAHVDITAKVGVQPLRDVLVDER
jgi:hypothetical protein